MGPNSTTQNFTKLCKDGEEGFTGAISITNITNVHFTENQAKLKGGGIHISHSSERGSTKLYISHSVFERNNVIASCCDHGGGLSIYHGSCFHS